MSIATKVIRQIAAGQVTGQVLRKRADRLVASSTCTTYRLEAKGISHARQPDPEKPSAKGAAHDGDR